jgi:hypothetical protein
MRRQILEYSCAPSEHSEQLKHKRFRSLSDLVSDYIRKRRGPANKEMEFFRSRPNLRAAIEYAALSKLPGGDRHPHQYRRSTQTLAEAERRLQAISSELRRCRSFGNLYTRILKEIGNIHDVGPLTVYDVANRIGAYLKLEPEEVYLHAGTAAGAKSLGLNCHREKFGPVELPPAFIQLKPREIEDCLCIYKDQFTHIHA